MCILLRRLVFLAISSSIPLPSQIGTILKQMGRLPEQQKVYYSYFYLIDKHRYKLRSFPRRVLFQQGDNLI